MQHLILEVQAALESSTNVKLRGEFLIELARI